jgi:FKBP-type peptidyl-prolyl cis-trans isomerase SlyD
VAVKEEDFIRLEYTGKIQETGDVFDTTLEEVARETGIHNEKKTYGTIPIVLGAGHVLKGIEDALIGMEEGDKKTVQISPEDGFGLRDPKLIQLIPMSEFRKQGIKPQMGMNITLEGHNGKIQSVSGGRVRVDFNHELAGKTLVYDVEVKQIIEDDLEKVRSMIELHYPSPNLDLDKTEIEIKKNKVIIFMDQLTRFDKRPYVDVTLSRFRIAKDIWENLEEIEKVEFADVFEKKETEKTEEEPEEPKEVAEEVLEENIEEKKE